MSEIFIWDAKKILLRGMSDISIWHEKSKKVIEEWLDLVEEFILIRMRKCLVNSSKHETKR